MGIEIEPSGVVGDEARDDDPAEGRVGAEFAPAVGTIVKSDSCDLPSQMCRGTDEGDAEAGMVVCQHLERRRGRKCLQCRLR